MTSVRKSLLTKYGSSFVIALLLFNLLVFTNINNGYAADSVTDAVYNEGDDSLSVSDVVYGETTSVSDAVYESGSFTVSMAVYGISSGDKVTSQLMDELGQKVVKYGDQQVQGEQLLIDFDNVAPGDYTICILINGVVAYMQNMAVADENMHLEKALVKVTGIISGLNEGVTAKLYLVSEGYGFPHDVYFLPPSDGNGVPFELKVVPGTYQLVIMAESYQDHTSQVTVDQEMDLGTIEMIPANNDGTTDDGTTDDGTTDDGTTDDGTTDDGTTDDGTTDDGTTDDGTTDDGTTDDGTTDDGTTDDGTTDDGTTDDGTTDDSSSDDGNSSSNSSSNSSRGRDTTSTEDRGTFSNSDIERVINNTAGAETGVKLVAPSGEKSFEITGEQLSILNSADKQVSVMINNVEISFNTEAYQLDSNAALSLSVTEVNSDEAKELVESTEYDQVGNIYDLNMETVQEGLSNKVESFNDAVNVALPVSEEYWQYETLHNSLDVFYFNEKTNNWEPMNASHDAINQALNFSTNHFSKYAVLKKPEINFSDVNGHWAEQSISAMAARGYIKGYQDNSFKPKANVTRAEFTAMLSRLLYLDNYEEMNFKDLAPEQWYYESVAMAYKAGIVNGYSTEEFKPNEYITREQMAVMISNALDYATTDELKQQNNVETFLDNSSISPWAKGGVEKVTAAGIIKGIPANGGLAFTPEKYASRAETAVMLARLNDLLENVL